MNGKRVVIIGYILCLTMSIYAALYIELVPSFNRIRSRAMIRKIDKPTLANLDYAAYNANPIRYDPERFKPKAPAKKATLADMTFNGNLAAPVNSLSETPLTEEERINPLAWIPLQNLLWSELKIDDFKRMGSSITAYKWADPDIFKPYQEVVACYLHTTDAGMELWVKVEFSPWVRFLAGITDEDKDGFAEIYGRLPIQTIDAEKREQTFTWIRDTYQKNVLTEAQIIDWITILASYWYPTLNTDMVDMSDQTRWPNENTEKKVRASMKKCVVKNPLAVVRGNPHGKPMYNVYVVSGMGKKDVDEKHGAVTAVKRKIDVRISGNREENAKRFKEELAVNGGSYEAWYKKNSPIVEKQKKILAGLPQGQMGFKGSEDWIFFRKSLEYTTAGDLGKQKEDKNPLIHIKAFKKFLEKRNINLLFIAVPAKVEIYYQQAGITGIKKPDAVIYPYGRKILSDLQAAGIEVIDLLPHFLAAKAEDTPGSEPVYQRQDTHWTNRGLQIAARLIADRIKRYAWYSDCADSMKKYIVKDTTCARLGDIIERLPESQQTEYRPATLQAQQVKMPDGSNYKGNRTDPILLIGDSFTGVFELVDCKSAGVGAHIAAKTGLGVDIITSWGGGPLVRSKMLRARKYDLGAKRLVIYMMAARDLYNYAQGWEKLKTEEKSKTK